MQQQNRIIAASKLTYFTNILVKLSEKNTWFKDTTNLPDGLNKSDISYSIHLSFSHSLRKTCFIFVCLTNTTNNMTGFCHSWSSDMIISHQVFAY